MKKPWIAISLVLLISFSCLPGNASVKNTTLDVTAFHDRNGDGRQSSDSYADENPVPNTLIIIESNIHGIMRRDVLLTGADGKAAITVAYTHILAAKVLPPCGSYPTTAINQDLAQQDTAEQHLIAFGFWNVIPSPQNSIIQLHIWEDGNKNGTSDAGEARPNVPLFVQFNIPFAMGSYSTDNIPLQTTQDGVSLDLGNSCGEIKLLLTPDWKTVSVGSPAKVTGTDMKGISIPYGPATLDIDWSVINEP